ncbi:hypothetical protein PIB30_063253 [Stylosanthes scabra]|uniref:Uncharacterized protein n=1 Tax=Stylosanthes scabra TaxID=79078 RepID=A0ABU6ZK57_9FABA|nr:hypothetical protein [Stylosanthes scabra]
MRERKKKRLLGDQVTQNGARDVKLSQTRTFISIKWKSSGCLAHDVPFVHVSDIDLTPNDVWADGYWNLDHLSSLLSPKVKLQIQQFNLFEQVGSEPGWWWNSSSSKIYSVWHGYEWLRDKRFEWSSNES